MHCLETVGRLYAANEAIGDPERPAWVVGGRSLCMNKRQLLGLL